MDKIPGLLWSALPVGKIEFCNQTWLDYTGMSLDQVRDGQLGTSIHAEDKPAVEEKWGAALTRGDSFEAEARMRRADGCYRWFLIRAVPLRDAYGEISRWYGTNVEIEDLKRAQEEVLKQTSRWDELFEQTPEAVAVLSTDDRIVRINKEFTRMFGYEPDEVLKHTVNDVIVPERLVESAREYNSQLKDGRRVEVETIRRRKDGSEVDVSLLAVPVSAASGEQVGNYAIYRDVTKRKRAEERLFESELRFQAIADTAPVLIWTTGTDGLCNYFSKPWLDFTGRTMEQEVGTGWIQGVHPDDVQGCFDGFLPAFHARKPFRMEYRLKRADGEYRWVDERGIPRYTAGGEFAGYIGCNIDITDRKRAESLLAGEKRVLEMVARGYSLAAILDTLCQFVEQQAHGVLASILLLDGDRLRHGGAPSLPTAYTDAIDGAAIGPYAGSCGTAAYRGEQVIVEDIATDPLWANYRDLALPHALRACWSTPIFSSQKQVIATFAMYYHEPRRPSHRDQEMIERITHLAGVAIERKLTQDELRRSEAYLAEAQRLTHTGSWVWRVMDRGAVYLSEEWYRIYGFDPDERMPDWDTRLERILAEDRAKWKDAIDRAMLEKADYDVEFRIVLPDGTVKWIHTVGHPMLNATGNLVQFVGISSDITERKRAEQERDRLRQLEADLAHINRVSMMGEFAASLAHEIKQPIAAATTNARTCLRWLLREPPEIEDARETVSRIVADVNRASDIINRVRSLYTKGSQERDLVDVNELIEEMVTLLRNEADRHLIPIRNDLAEDLPKVMADRVQLQQVFMNIMLNGIEAMKGRGGQLTLKSEQTADAQLLVSVSDTGVGLPAERADKVFEAFFTTKPQGTGMGLSISRSIIESHGGRLWAEANSGPGATFHFTLPAAAGAAGASRAGA